LSWLDDLRIEPVPGLSMSELATLRYIAERSDYDTGRNSWPSLDTIARAIAGSVTTVRRAVRVLARRGLLLVEQLGDGRLSSRYVVVVDAVRAALRRRSRGATVTPLGSRGGTPGVSPRDPTTTKTTTRPLARPVIDQLALALLDVDESENTSQITPAALNDARAHAAQLPDGTAPADVRDALRVWCVLGRDRRNATPAALVKAWPQLHTSEKRGRHRPTLGASCALCDGMRVVLDADGARARRCPGCTSLVP
jgi:hypothetical protein